MKTFDVDAFRKHFPILSQRIEQHKLVYFDNAATLQKPASVIEGEREFYLTSNANVHRGAHHLSSRATELFEQARSQVQSFIGARSNKEIIWTKGTTESINLVAQSWGGDFLQVGDEIVLSYAEHHANIVPWQAIATKTGAKIKVLPLSANGQIDETQLDNFIGANTKIVCCTHLSNVLGKFNPIEQIIEKAKRVGALTLIDGAQAIAHTKIDVQALGCDFYVFSAHKLYGPTGVGVLYGKAEILVKMSPYQFGGEMIKNVSFSGTSYNELPFKFEAGTPNIAGCIAFAKALEFVLHYRLNDHHPYKQQLTRYTYEKLSQINGLNFVVPSCPDIPLFSFNLDNIHQQDVAAELDAKGIAIRAGHHCTMPLMEQLKLSGCLRVSLSAYNTFAEVDYLIHCLTSLIEPSMPSQHAFNEQQETAVVSADVEHILSLFAAHKSWDSKHRQLMLLGKSLPRMDKTLRVEQRLIHGCESAAWLDIQRLATGRYVMQGDSDAKIIRGLMVIVFAAFNQRSAEQILTFNMQDYFAELGLLKHLSPSRGNGLLAIVEHIKAVVSETL